MQNDIEDRNESITVESSTLALLQKADIDTQITTAHKFPRSVKKFIGDATQLATLDEATANECSYSLPRDGKMITGPSARFAEIIASSWGNLRSGARVVDDTGKFIVAQGVCHDLERNNSVTFEVQRRITDKGGRRYKDDMIGVTGNAAASIAFRNAVLKVVPKALWAPIYDAALHVIRGDIKTLTSRRAQAMDYLGKMGATPEAVFARLEISGVEDVTLDHLVVLKGMIQAIKDGDTSIEEQFPTPKKTASDLNERLKTSPDAPESTQGETATETAADPNAGKGDETPTPASKKTRTTRPKEKPPAQTVGAASIGDTAQVGQPGVNHADTDIDRTRGADDSQFDLE